LLATAVAGLWASPSSGAWQKIGGPASAIYGLGPYATNPETGDIWYWARIVRSDFPHLVLDKVWTKIGVVRKSTSRGARLDDIRDKAGNGRCTAASSPARLRACSAR
jgi:hypothetical protein